MRGLAQESSDLPFTSVSITSSAKAREGIGSGDESTVSVESLARASTIISMFKHLIKLRTCDDTAKVSSAGTTALALAAATTVIISAATPTK
jgi:hypothetical protein